MNEVDEQRRIAVDVRLFGRYRELAAGSRIRVELPARATVADLVTELHRRHPGALPPRPLVAVDHRPADDEVGLGGAADVALVPPAAGG